MQTLRPLIAIAGLSLTGCTVFPPVAATSATPPQPAVCSPDAVAALPAGAEIAIEHGASEDGEQQTTGTVLKASPEGVALINCRVEHRTYHATPVVYRVPYMGRLFKNTGVGTTRTPVLWVPRYEMTEVRVVQPPPADYVAADIALDTTYGEEFERIGIDFDFAIPSDVPPGTVVPIDHIERTVVTPSHSPRF